MLSHLPRGNQQKLPACSGLSPNRSGQQPVILVNRDENAGFRTMLPLRNALPATIFDSMLEIGSDTLVDYLHASDHLAAGVAADVEALAWGVSNVVLRVQPEKGDDFVVKQSRSQLRTKADWFSRLDRIYREADVMRTLHGILPTGVIPEILFEDRENYLFAMEAVAADHAVWKGELLAGRVESSIAREAGKYLGAIHRHTAGDADLHCRFGDREVFIELRVDPFYRHLARVHADVAAPIERMIEEMFATQVCLVHADFSPKNILITNGEVALVDFETGHFGDPAFDLGFFLSHLLLKTVLFAQRRDEFLGLAREFLTCYFAEVGDLGTIELQRRTISHLAGCMWSRIDATSRVDYLPHDEQQELVRRYCRTLFLNPPRTLEETLDQLDNALQRLGESAGPFETGVTA
jgi:5-methylthioribose kinase